MAERLTDKTAKTAKPVDDDLVHVIDVSDVSQNAAGSSFKMKVDDFLKGRAFIMVQNCHTLKGVGNESRTVLEVNDFVIYQNVGNNILILATILATITTVPTDLRDSAKAANWLDASAAL